MGASKRKKKKASRRPTRRPTKGRINKTINTGTSHSSDSYDHQLLFVRIRRQARWAFVLLTVLFALGFIVFGVGSGGTGIGDLLRGGNLFGNSSPGTSLADFEKKALDHPSKAINWQNLAIAYQNHNRNKLAFKAWRRYVILKPHNDDGLVSLASISLSEANLIQNKIGAIQGDLPRESPYPLSGNLALAAGDLSPLSSAIQSAQQAKLKPLQTSQSQYLVAAFSAYKSLVLLHPQNGADQLMLARLAINQGNYKVALPALRAYLRWPQKDAATAKLVRKEIKTLEPLVNPK